MTGKFRIFGEYASPKYHCLISLNHFVLPNRICCGYGKGSYSLTVSQQERVVSQSVDGDVINLSGGNFTDSESVSFGGDCVAPSTDPKPDPPSCVDVTLSLIADSFPSETSVNLTDMATGEVFWADTVIDEAGATYEWSQCIDPEGCHLLIIGDSYGDGLSGDGFDLTYDGEVVASGGFSGTSFEYNLGNGC